MKYTGISLAFLAALSAPITSQAGLGEVMQNAFNSDMNVTEPGAYMGARRGAVTFGKVRQANQISTPQLVSFIPPGGTANCSGIDMWGGSFSFVSGRQLEAFAQNVISNAKGYAFQLALDNFPSGKDAVKTMQDWANKINGGVKSSCEVAKMGVNEMFGEIRANAALADQAGSKDAFTSFTGSTPATSRVSAQTLIEQQTFRPNPIYSAIKESGITNWFQNGDGNFAKSIMSFTGAIAIDINADGQGSSKSTPYPSILDVKTMVIGGSDVSIYQCNNDDTCDAPTTIKMPLRGFQDLIYESLVGANGSTGIIDKFNSGLTGFSVPEKQFLGALSPNVGALIKDLSRDPGVAKQFTKDAVTVIAYNTACDMTSEVLRAVGSALSAIQWSGKSEAMNFLTQARKDQFEQCNSASKGASDLLRLMQIHQQFKAQMAQGK